MERSAGMRTSFNNSLLSSYNVPGTIIGVWGVVKNRTKSHSPGVYISRGDIESKQVDSIHTLAQHRKLGVILDSSHPLLAHI